MIQYIAWSPLETFLVTWERHTPSSDGNLIAWKVETGEIVAKLHQKTFVKDFWPTLQWTADEALCGYAVSNEVQFYDGKTMNTHVVKYRIKCEGVSALFTASTASASYRFAVFKPEKKVPCICVGLGGLENCGILLLSM